MPRQPRRHPGQARSSPPPAIDLMDGKPATCCGALFESFQTVPSFRSTMLPIAVLAAATTLEMPTTGTGASRVVVVPSPRIPPGLIPKLTTVPSGRTSRVLVI